MRNCLDVSHLDSILSLEARNLLELQHMCNKTKLLPQFLHSGFCDAIKVFIAHVFAESSLYIDINMPHSIDFVRSSICLDTHDFRAIAIFFLMLFGFNHCFDTNEIGIIIVFDSTVFDISLYHSYHYIYFF